MKKLRASSKQWTQAEVRKKVRDQSLSEAQRSELSQKLCRHFVQSLGLELERQHKISPVTLGLYKSLPHEVEVSAIEEWAHAHGIRIAYPLISGDEVDFFVIEDSTQVMWKKNPNLGVEEPSGSGLAKISGHALTVVLTPGRAFSRQGVRVGRGKGYFDRYFAKNPAPLKVGVAFSFQIFDSIEINPWDVKMDLIFSDEGKIYPPSERSASDPFLN